MSNRFDGLLAEQAEHLSAFVKAKKGLESVKGKLALAKSNAQATIEKKREEQAKLLARLQAEINEENKAIAFVDLETKKVSKKIKSINKIVG